MARFALPGAVAAMVGAWLLNLISTAPPVYMYQWSGQQQEATIMKLVIGVLIILFALFDLLPGLRRIEFDRRYLTLGGLLSGFFGGLSGNQGALCSAFLIKAGLKKEAFIGAGNVSST
jgi:hypothetical protein